MKIKRSNRGENLQFLVAIAMVVLFAVALSACVNKTDAPVSAPAPAAEAPSTKAPEDAAAPPPPSLPEHATLGHGKFSEKVEINRKALDSKELEARLEARKLEARIETRKEEAQKKFSAPERQIVMATRKEHVDQKAVQDIGKAGEKANHDTGKIIAMAPAPEPKKSNLENYSVTVSANKLLAIPGPPGELRVWIGISSNAPRIQPGMITETKELEAVGETAKVTPFTLGIDVEPKVSVCEKIDPSGSEVRFKLIPSKPGVFTVGANVELYDSKDCSGPPVPKSAKSVEVKVSVDKGGVITNAVTELAVAAWKAFLDFWDKVLLLIFALILFLIRKKLFKWFGFKDKE